MKKIFVPILFIVFAIGSVYVVHEAATPFELQVSFLDVGQGDAIFIQSPSGVQVLIDGGKDASVLEELHKVMPLFDRSIDVVVATHPDSDHISGLIDVVKKFRVGAFLESGAQNKNGVQDALNRTLALSNIQRKIAKRGEVYNLGGGVLLDVLYPYKDVSKEESNAGSLIMKLSYGEDSFLLTGDAPITSELILAGTDGTQLKSSVLKFGHHGSDTSTSIPFLQNVRPLYGIVSAGKNNQYGHPHKDVLEQAQRFNVKILSTAELGTITFSTNGKGIEVLGLSEDFQVEKPE